MNNALIGIFKKNLHKYEIDIIFMELFMSAANLRMNNKRNQYHLICRVISICLCALFCLSFGCTSKKEERLQEIDFTVVDDDEIPEELKTIIDQKKTGEFKLTYADTG